MFAGIDEANGRCVDCNELSNSEINKIENEMVDGTLKVRSAYLAREEAFEFSLGEDGRVSEVSNMRVVLRTRSHSVAAASSTKLGRSFIVVKNLQSSYRR